MRLGDLADIFTEDRFGSMKTGIIGLARRDFGKPNGRYRLRVFQIFAGLVEVIGGFRLHRSRPSRRNSAIRPVRCR